MPARFSGGYILPPRAEIVRKLEALPGYDAGKGWLAQVKKNGTNSLVFVHPNRNVVGWNRHGEQHRAWHFDDRTSAIFRNLPGNGWFVFNGELLHKLGHKAKPQHYLYDILVADGIHLTGTEYQLRYQLLFDVLAQGLTFAAPTPATQSYRLDDYTSIARNYSTGFAGVFADLTAAEDEGLVLRRAAGIYYGPKADDWMVKFRRKELTKLY